MATTLNVNTQVLDASVRRAVACVGDELIKQLFTNRPERRSSFTNFLMSFLRHR